jgi:hypothetical protein
MLAGQADLGPPAAKGARDVEHRYTATVRRVRSGGGDGRRVLRVVRSAPAGGAAVNAGMGGAACGVTGRVVAAGRVVPVI